MVLLAFLFAVVLTLAATAVLIVRGLALYRQTRHTTRALSVPLSTFEAKAAEVDRHLDAFEHSSQELERAREQLKRSRARLQVLLDSIESSQARLRWLRVFIAR